jgi:hypothetical protein
MPGAFISREAVVPLKNVMGVVIKGEWWGFPAMEEDEWCGEYKSKVGTLNG